MTLGLLSRGDIDHRADEARGVSVVKDRIAGRSDPALDTVPQTDCAILDIVRVTRGDRQGALHRVMGRGAIIRMNARKKCVVSHLCVGRQSKHGLAAFVPAQHLRHRIEIPRADRCRFRRKI